MAVDRKIIEDRLLQAVEANRSALTKVAHYTRLETLLHLLGPGGITSLRATGIRYLNDRNELTHGLRILNQDPGSEKFKAAFAQIESASPDVYQVSFSGAPDELGQWRGYANNGIGCSVEVDRSALDQAGTFSGWVIYDETAQKTFAASVVQALRSIRPGAEEAGIYLLAAASFMKHPGFAPEMEFRVLLVPSDSNTYQMRVSGDRLAPYFDLLQPGTLIAVSRVLLGPGWQLGTLSKEQFIRHHVPLGVQRLLTLHGIAAQIEPSSIPYDPR